MIDTTKGLFEISARECFSAVARGSPDCFEHMATMVALCRIDSPNPDGMSANIQHIEDGLRARIANGTLSMVNLPAAVSSNDVEQTKTLDAALAADGFLTSTDLDRLEGDLGRSIRSGGLGHVGMPLHNCDLGALLAEVSSYREWMSTTKAAIDTQVTEIVSWRNCFICIECGRCSVDEDGCCTTCGRDCLHIVDGKLVNTGVADHFDAMERVANRPVPAEDPIPTKGQGVTHLQDHIDALRRQLDELASRVRIHDSASAFIRGEHPIREGDYFLLSSDTPTRLQNISSEGKWTYFDGHHLIEPFARPKPGQYDRLYTIAEVAEIIAVSSSGLRTWTDDDEIERNGDKGAIRTLSEEVGRLLAELLGQVEQCRSVTGDTSDGYHTFNELYDHRVTLFLALCDQIRHHAPELVWRSKLHSDGTSIDGWFVAGICTEPGRQITYHLPLSRWDEAGFLPEIERGPTFDGHTSANVLQRLRRLYERT